MEARVNCEIIGKRGGSPDWDTQVPQQPTEEPTGHKAAVYQPGYFKQENKYCDDFVLL